MKSSNIKSRKQLTTLALVAVLGVAVYLNWEYAKSSPELFAEETDIPVGISQTGIALEEISVTEPVMLAEPVMQQNETSEGNKNYGDAQLVSAGMDSSLEYFEKAELNRKKNRDHALEKLQKTLKDSQLDKSEKEKITQELTALLHDITIEGDIESMVKAKGFSGCLASIQNNKVNLTVSTTGEALTAAQVSQLRDIILNKTIVEAKNITIVEVK